jgi:NAD+ synthetase
MPALNINALIDNRCEAIRQYHESAGLQRAELDVSGGIDSAVMLMLLAKALGPENITAVYSSIHSSDVSRSRAQAVAKAAGVSLCEVEATKAYDELVLAAIQSMLEAGVNSQELQARIDADPTIKGSLRSCIRAPLGRFMNRMTGGGIRHGTGNEDEDRWLRFYQKGGDGEVDTNPLAMLSKGEVYQMAVALGVPEEIITCMPTPDLWGTGDAHNDEEELSKLSGCEWTYSRVDPKTGEYVRVGTIERMSRFLDIKENPERHRKLFGSVETWGPEDELLDRYVEAAAAFGLTREHLASARKWEQSTRHKLNPNCPSLGRRQDLIYDGLITDELPEV